MDYRKLAEIIKKIVKEQIDKQAPRIRLGTVVSVAAKSIEAIIDGSASPASIHKGCSCSAGDRVVILKEGTQFYAIARIGG